MSTRTLNPIAAFDIIDGTPTAIDDPWPGLEAASGYRWLHLDLTQDSVEPWAREHLPRIARHALLQTETRPRCDLLEDGLILNLRGVNLNPEASPDDMVSLRIWVTRTALVTARVRKVWAVDEMRKAAQNGQAPDSIGAFLVELVTGLTARIETVSLDLEDQTDRLEDQLFDGRKPARGQLTGLRQSVIRMRRFIAPQRDAITALMQLEDWLMTRQERAHLREAGNRTRRIVEELESVRDRLQTLQDQLEADHAQRLGRHSHILSIVAAIFLPLGFLTGLFGVNIAGMPGMVSPMAFWWLVGGSVALGVVLYLVFKLADWL